MSTKFPKIKNNQTARDYLKEIVIKYCKNKLKDKVFAKEVESNQFNLDWFLIDAIITDNEFKKFIVYEGIEQQDSLDTNLQRIKTIDLHKRVYKFGSILIMQTYKQGDYQVKPFNFEFAKFTSKRITVRIYEPITPAVYTNSTKTTNNIMDYNIENRITNDNITDIKQDEVFVFGSNLSGRHGKGAAKTALTWGAIWGQGVGIQGRTYGIPTKEIDVRTSLPIHKIKEYVDEFIKFAEVNSHLKFYVTEIGCGLANFKYEEIAPLFKNAVVVENIYLPKKFWEELNYHIIY